MIKVFVVDDHRLFLSGVRAELADRDGINPGPARPRTSTRR